MPVELSNNYINCLIVDDEPLAREVMRRYISRVPELILLGECENAIDAMATIRQNKVDLIFLDIQMPEILGTDFILILKEPPKIILTTAFPQYALQGYELDITDYLLKPIQFERFLKAVNKILKASHETLLQQTPEKGKTEQPKSPYLFFRTDRKMTKVMLEDIIYIEGMKNYVKILTSRGMLINKNSIAAIEAMLPEDLFLRVHRSYIISRAKIESFTSELVEIQNRTIPIGKLFRNSVLKALDPSSH